MADALCKIGIHYWKQLPDCERCGASVHNKGE
jgi:hypothetical protein